ncbi:MAG: hypothetical protein HW406_3 [Candidatus Brocadiaceae bacterium]|nr:hypothetical protein [Candidatus Brocadiaceae bacterium]
MQKFINSQLIANHDVLPEEQFIVMCLRFEFDKKAHANCAPFTFIPIDWDIVYAKAIQRHIAPLLYKALINQSTFFQSLNIPNDFLAKLQTTYVKTFYANKKNYDSLAAVLEVFNKEGIKAIFLKGSFLAHFVYKDIGLRSMSDIDILVKKDDLGVAERQLSLLGCEFLRTTQDRQVLDYLIEKHRTSHHHLHPFIHPKGTKPLEVHWMIVHQNEPFNINIEALWERAKPAQIHGKNVHVLSPEDTLLNHSLHASYCNKLVLSGLRSCCDTAAIINHYQQEIDWKQLQLRAYEWGAAKYLYLTLRLSQEILGAAVPEGVLQNLQPKSFNEGLFLESEKRVITAKAADAVPDVKRFNPHGSFVDKIHLFLQRIFIPRKELAVCYSLPVSSKSIYFFYIVRLFSLLYSVPFILRLLINKKGDTCQNNLDLWLLFPDA